MRRPITRYLEATGNTAPIKNVDLVARVQGFLQSINYQDGAFVKEGTPLFAIEPETYKLKLDQAQAAEAGAQASLKQADADYKRQVDLVNRQAVSQATLDTSTSNRDNAQANLQQAQANTKIAAVNYGYTNVTRAVRWHCQCASGFGWRTGRRRLADVACNHRGARSDLCEFQRQRAGCAANPCRSQTTRPDDGRPQAVADRDRLQTEEGYPHRGKLDYVAPTINQSTGTLPVRGILSNPDRVLLPGYYVRIRVPFDQQQSALLVRMSHWAAISRGRYVLVVNGDNVVEQRKVQTGPIQGELRVIDGGLKPDDRVVVAGLLRAIPAKRSNRNLQQSSRQRRRPNRTGHDFEILHRAAGTFQRHRDPDDPDWRRLPVAVGGRAVSRRGTADGAGHHPAIPAPAPRP